MKFTMYGPAKLSAILLVWSFTSASFAATLYVSPSGAAVFPFDAWSNAAVSIGQALGAATNGDRIVVGPGTYAEHVDLGVSEIELVSTYALSQQWALVESTIIDGGGSGTCVRVAGGQTSQSLVQGFTLLRGVAQANSASYDERGGGLLVESSSPRVQDLVIRECAAAVVGGGAYFYASQSPVDHLVIESNSAGIGGGGLAAYASTQTFTRLSVGRNSTDMTGGGLQFYHSAVTVRSSQVTFNFAGQMGGAMHCNGGQTYAQNCTIAGNIATQAGGLAVGFQALVSLRDSILWSNNVAEIELDPQWTGMSVSGQRTVLLGGSNAIVRHGMGGVDWPTNNFSFDPLFADASLGELQPGTPVRDLGQVADWMTNALDLAGGARVAGLSVDLGAYEVQGPSPYTLVGVPTTTNYPCGVPVEIPLVVAQGGCEAPVSGSGLRLWYRMDAATNTATPDAAGFHGGIGTNVVWTNQGWSGRAATFNGVSSGFQIPALTEVNRATGLTFGAWIRTATQNLQGVMGKTANGNSCFYMAISSNGWIDITVDRTDGSHLHARTNGVVAVGEWHHVMGTYDGVQVVAYVDGRPVVASGVTNFLPVRSNSVVAAVGDTSLNRGWRFSGQIDEVKLYTRALSSGEVAAVQRDVRMMESAPTSLCPRTWTRVWMASNACGDSVSATQQLVQADLAPPSLVGMPQDLDWFCGMPLAVTAQVTAIDQCSSATVSMVEIAAPGCPATVQRVWTAVDGCGLMTVATQSISLSEGPALEIVAPPDVVTNCGAVVRPARPTITGGCAGSLANGLVLRYDYASLSGTNLFDAGPQGNHGVAVGGASLTTGKASFGTALLLDGVNDHVRVPRNSDFSFTNFTLATWLRASSSSAGRRRLISQQDATTNGYWIMSLYNNRLEFGSFKDNILTNAGPALNDNQWHFVAVVRDVTRTQATWMVDGQVVRTQSLVSSAGYAITEDVYVGRVYNALEYFSGALDETRVYSRALSVSELNQLMLTSSQVVVRVSETTNGTCPSVLSRVWAVEDWCGNTAAATQQIARADTVPPVLVGVPGPQQLACGVSLPPIPTVTATDCSTAQVSFAEFSTTGCPGVVTRIWTAVDACGNTSVATQLITITTPPPPTLTAPADAVVDCAANRRPRLPVATGGCGSEVLNGLILRYDFETGSVSRVYDVAPLQNHGVPEGAPATVSGPVGFGSGLQFEGDDYVRIPRNSDFNLTNFTLAAWIKTDNAGAGRRRLVGYQESGTNGYWFMALNDNRLELGSYHDGILNSRGGLLNDGQWHFVAVVRDAAGATVRWVVDGATVSTNLIGGQQGYQTAEQDLYVGRLYSGSEAYLGQMDDVRIYERALSDAELAAVMQPPVGERLALQVLTTGDCSVTEQRIWTVTDRCGQTAIATQLLQVTDTTPPVLIGVPTSFPWACGAVLPLPPTVSALDACHSSSVVFAESSATGCPATVFRTWTASDACGNTIVATQVISLITPPALLVQPAASVTGECVEAGVPALPAISGGCMASLLDGLLLRYDFDHVTGTTVSDRGPLGYTGTLAGGVTTVTAQTEFGAALRLDGQDDYVAVPPNPSVQLTNFTLMAWIRTPDAGWGRRRIISHQDPTNGYWLLALNGNQLEFGSSADNILSGRGPLLNDNQWHLVAVVRDVQAARARWVIDGVEVGSVALTNSGGLAISGTDMQVGRLYQGGEAFAGDLDEVRVYQRALSSNELVDARSAPGSLDVQLAVQITGTCPRVTAHIWQVTDRCGQVAVATQTITSVDTQAPLLGPVPAPFAWYCDDVLPAAATVTAFDACTTATVLFAEAVSTGCPGLVTRTWTATDLCGNTAVATQLVTLVARDADGDGLDYFTEVGLGTDPDLADSDGDGRPDGREVTRGFDPLASTSFPRVVRNDFDGEGESDLLVYHAAAGTWYALRTNSIPPNQTVQWGWSSATPVLADFDGDAVVDHSVYFPPNGNWYIRRSSSGSLQQLGWGWIDARPVPGDYDGDGQDDVAVYHPAAGNWYVRRSSTGTLQLQSWGWSTATPVPGDYDGDGTTDFAVYHQAAGNWYVRRSSNGSLFQLNWGWSGAQAVPADYDGDGLTDLAVYYPAGGTWFIRRSSDGSLLQQNWGWIDALPAAADYDHDGRADITVYHPATGTWYIRLSSSGALRQRSWGWSAALPVLSP